jgi:predicted ATPase/class 3 adenylate cyclase/DNA-binding CsgD family transcriptional regulator
MIRAVRDRMLANMSQTSCSNPEIDPEMSELPTGTVTLLLADVEGSTRLWQSQPEQMKAAVARLDQTLSQAVAANHGVRPVEQGEGDSFVIAFARAADAVDCALALQQAPLAPIKLRIGVHTGDVQLRDPTTNKDNYVGSTINRTARLRDLAHGGQTVLSGTTELLVVDQLPPAVTLTDLGSHPLRDFTRPERVFQLCHPDLCNEFPPLRIPNAPTAHNLPTQLTSFVGRGAQIAKVSELLDTDRLVTLTGAGGAGKTRLAVEVAAQLTSRTTGGVWYVDLAPITHADVVPVAVARALGLPDQPGRSTDDTLIRFISDRRLLIVLDNCEHLLDASASLATEMLTACPELRLLTTSREPLGIPGEVTFVVPSLSLADEAIELFTDRARRTQPDFAVGEDNAATVTEICRRLDGMPLAIELAAARVRALTLDEILAGLHDRFRLLAGGARRAVRRQQTLRASVDWSHELLTETERALFRRLAVFLGGFDVDAAHAIAGDEGGERYQILDQLSLLVDKSLLRAENNSGRTRYQLLETVRQYALEKLGESGEADTMGARHRDYYTAMAAELDSPTDSGHARRLAQAEVEIDNMRGAFAWSLENSESVPALRLAASLQPLWFSRWRYREGLSWLDAALAAASPIDAAQEPARVQVLADKAVLLVHAGSTEGAALAAEALGLAREIGEPALVIRALIAHGNAYAHDSEAAGADFLEAGRLARELDDRWRLSQILGWQAVAAMSVGDHVAINAAACEGCDLAGAIGDDSNLRMCRLALATAPTYRGEVAQANALLRDALAEAIAAHDPFCREAALLNMTFALAWQGDVDGAQAAADACLNDQTNVGELVDRVGYSAIGLIRLMAGDAVAAHEAYEAALLRTPLTPATVNTYVVTPLPLLACGDLTAARRRADEVVSLSTGVSLVAALSSRARVGIAQGDIEQAALDARDALIVAAETHGYMTVPDAFECLAHVAADAGNHREAARLLGVADAARQQNGVARFKIFESDHEGRLAAIRDQLGESDFRTAWDEGASLSIEEAIAYVRRGRGERKRASSGWASLTRAELDVVRLVSEGLDNKSIAARLFVSPRTVQAHLTHIYTKLALTSRVQLAQEAGRHG